DRFNEENGRIFMVDKYRLFEGVRRFLEMQCLNKPLFISLDNIHWADDSSLELLHYLIRSLKKSPIFFFLIFRIEEIKDSKFQNVLQLMERECLCNKIHLEPIEINGVARMLSLILDAKPSTKLLKYIFNETGGNPFFVEELIKSLEENEALIWDTNEWIFNKSKRVVIPSSIEGVVDRKLDMIGEEVQNILEYMAVIGKRFDFSFLQDLTGTNEGHLFDLIDDILEVRLLEESKGETYYFSEDIIREIVYRKINEAKLKHHHQKVGERLLKLHKDHIEEVIEDLANHFYRSGDLEKALKYSIVAGDRASDSYANTDAIRFYTWAIDCLKEGKIEDKELKQIECLENRANVLKLNGEAEKALEDLELAIKLSEEIGNRKEEANCLIILSKVYQDVSRYNEATRMAKKALTIYRKLKDRDGEAESIGNTANIYFYLGEYQKALEFNQRSLKIRKEIANSQGQASILNSIGIIYQSLGNYSEALKFFQDSLEIIEVIGDRKLKATNLNNIGIINYNLGNYSDALNLYKRSLDIFRDMGDRKGAARGLANIGSIYHVLCKYSKAFEFYANSLKIIEEIGDISGVATILHNMGLVSYSLYNHDKALELYKRSLGIVEEIGDKKIELANLSCIGDIYLEMDDFPVAERYLNKAYSIAREIKSKSLLTYVLLHLANFYLRKDNLAEVKRILKGIFTLVDEIGTKEYKAGAFSVSGLVYTKEKKWKKATSAFKEAISIFKKLETEFDLAKVYYHFGLMLKASGDKTNAKKYFTKAKKIFKKVKASEWIKKIETDNKKSKP
ncbi:tetratricopeptide repeat protein, partial [candidate division WOR-3 bacterium]|nr:tetratricopeptide repeat protein [candidate division WOR-3 bacterium]